MIRLHNGKSVLQVHTESREERISLCRIGSELWHIERHKIRQKIGTARIAHAQSANGNGSTLSDRDSKTTRRFPQMIDSVLGNPLLDLIGRNTTSRVAGLSQLTRRIDGHDDD